MKDNKHDSIDEYDKSSVIVKRACGNYVSISSFCEYIMFQSCQLNESNTFFLLVRHTRKCWTERNRNILKRTVLVLTGCQVLEVLKIHTLKSCLAYFNDVLGTLSLLNCFSLVKLWYFFLIRTSFDIARTI